MFYPPLRSVDYYFAMLRSFLTSNHPDVYLFASIQHDRISSCCLLKKTHRVAATTNPDCNRLYLRKKMKRSTPLGEDEVFARQRFSAVTRAVSTRAKNLNTISQDQAAFNAQKNSAGGYKTFKSWLWAQEGETYDTAHPRA